MEYRPDIQILRAIAVGLVLCFHLKVPGFASGFLGVDIFFVISGYLMQSLYGDGVLASDFYRRRARRLFPAYYGLVLATLIVSVFVTLPAEFANVVQQSLFASVFASNIGFWLQISYFDSSQFKPLLHLWSLGVEVQFYLLFPLLTRVHWRWLMTLFVGSLAICFAAVLVSPKLAFFLVPFRIWEFVIGMLAARVRFNNRRLGLAACLLTILCVAIPVDGQARNIVFGHPGLPALGVTLLTAVVLICRLPSPLEQSLPGRAAQKIGNASYSIYLAHFPVIVLLNYQPFGGTRLGPTFATVPLIIIAALMLYFGLERPGPRLFSIRRCMEAAVSIASLALLLPYAQIMRFSERDQRIFASLQDRSEFRCGRIFRVLHPKETFCLLTPGRAILLVGDSHADAIKVSFAKVAARHGFGTWLSVDNTPALAKDLRQEAQSRGAQWVFIDYAEPHMTPQLVEQAKRQVGDRLIVIEPAPFYEESVPQVLLERRTESPQWARRPLEQYLREHPDIRVLKTVDALCHPVCDLKDREGRPYYFDRSHLTLTGARQLEPTFDRFFGSIQSGSTQLAHL